MPSYEFPRPAFSTDIAVVAGEAPHILLVRRGSAPFAGTWALPGGFVDEYERPADAARRELREETGMHYDGPFEVVGVYGDSGRDPRGWTVSALYLAVLPEIVDVRGGDDAADARWFAADGLPELAFDHSTLVSDAFAAASRRSR